MTKKLILTLLLVAVLSFSGTVNAVVFSFSSGRKHFSGDLPDDALPPEQDPAGGAEPGVQEMMVKPKPHPVLPPIPKPQPKPQPKPKATPVPAPGPKPTTPVTKPS